MYQETPDQTHLEGLVGALLFFGMSIIQPMHTEGMVGMAVVLVVGMVVVVMVAQEDLEEMREHRVWSLFVSKQIYRNCFFHVLLFVFPSLHIWFSVFRNRLNCFLKIIFKKKVVFVTC
jgi:hypothetical protein